MKLEREINYTHKISSNHQSEFRESIYLVKEEGLVFMKILIIKSFITQTIAFHINCNIKIWSKASKCKKDINLPVSIIHADSGDNKFFALRLISECDIDKLLV